FVVDAARDRNNRLAQRQLDAMGPPPHVTLAQFRTRARWAYNFGGITRNATLGSTTRSLLASLVLSPDYGPVDTLRAIRGITASQAALLPELADINLTRDLPHVDVPVTMIQGRNDHVAPGAAAQQYFDA